MSYNWQILRAAVEQEILFPSREAYEDYITGLRRKDMPYQVMGVVDNDDGTVTAIMRKRYNPHNAFLWSIDGITNELAMRSKPAGDRYTGEEVQEHG